MLIIIKLTRIEAFPRQALLFNRCGAYLSLTIPAIVVAIQVAIQQTLQLTLQVQVVHKMSTSVPARHYQHSTNPCTNVVSCDTSSFAGALQKQHEQLVPLLASLLTSARLLAWPSATFPAISQSDVAPILWVAVTMESSSYADGEEAASSSDVAHFVSLTSCPVDQAAFFLEATNGNFDQAIEMYYGMILSNRHVTASGDCQL